MVRGISLFIVRRRLLLLVVLGLATIFFSYHAVKLPIMTFLPDLLPQDHPYVKLIQQYIQFGGTNLALIEVRAKKGDIFQPGPLKKVIEISKRALFCPGVDRNKVYSIGIRKVKAFKISEWGMAFPSLMFPDPPQTDEEMDELKKNIYSNPLYYGQLLSIDSKSALISMEFFDTGVNYLEIYDEFERIRRDFQGDDVSIRIVGDPYLYGVIKHHLDETGLIFLVTIFAMLLVAYIYTRSFRLVFVPLFSAIICAIWGMGFMKLCGYNLDPIVLVVPLLISATALSHSIQFNWRINKEYAESGRVDQACTNTIQALLYPGVAGILTDAAGILLIAFIPVPILAKLGLGSFGWVLSMIFVVLILNPVIYLYLPPMKNAKKWSDKRSSGFMERTGLIWVGKISGGKRAWGVLLIAAVLAAVAANWSLQLKIGDLQPGSAILKDNSLYNTDGAAMAKIFPGMMDPLLVIAEGTGEDLIKDPRVLNAVSEMQYRLMQTPEILGTVSIVDLIKNLHMAFFENNPKYFYLPNTAADIGVVLYWLMSGGAEPGDFDRYYTYDYKATNLMAFVDGHTSETMNAVMKNCEDFVSKNNGEGVNLRLAAGRIGMLTAINESVERNQTAILIAVFALTFIFCAFFFKSFTAGLILIVPLGLATLFTFAYMALNSIGINTNTLPVSSIAIGIGVDYGIYLMSRTREEYKGDLGLAIAEAIRTVGNAVVITGLIIILGVVFWNFSTIKFQADMGLLLSITTCFHLLGALILLPAIIRIVKPKFIGKQN